ncbi:MAG: preprotein translocase subunit SecA [Patescibacteria group bacterium]
MSFITSLFNHSEKEVKRYRKTVEKINTLEDSIKSLSAEDLKQKTAEFRERLLRVENPETLDMILPEAFAVVREASRRTRGERHYDVQLIGGMILHEGRIAEMKTGEGKTLMATLAAYLNAIEGKGVHIVTVNDYLSRRDAAWMGEIYHALGITVGVINHDSSYLFDPSHLSKEEETEGEKKESEVGSFKVVVEFLRPVGRKEAYAADITYGTNNEFGFDYLRDNIEHFPQGIRQRSFNFSIVDEVDSILIDESRTPLIISMPVSDAESLYPRFSEIAQRLQPEIDYTVDEKSRTISLTQEGIDKAEKELGMGNIYSEGGVKYVHHLETAIRAKALYLNNDHYIVKDGEAIIVDPSTGRLQPGRRWSEGLHQAIEAKEGVKIQQESRSYASITFQNYFRLYPKLSGMTGTAKTSSEEFLKVYGLDVIEVPTHRPVARQDKTDLIFQTEAGKFKALARTVKELNKKGQPVLIGTVSIEKNQLLSDYLKREGIPHTLLNAKPEFAEREGEIVAQAGKKGGVTIATNMAGRGVDIKLGGAPSSASAYEEVKALGGLYVIGTERHEARRIDNQLRGRSGRQGDPGETQFYVSLEDSLMRIFATDMLKNVMGRFKIPEDEPIQNGIVSRALENAQTKIEGFHFDSRKHVLEYDDVLNQQRKKTYERRRKILLGDQEAVESVLGEILARVSEEDRVALEAKRIEVGAATNSGDTFLSMTKGIILQTIDLFWVDHLEMMDYLRNSVNLRAYGQRDPLVEYKREGLHLFKEMEQAVDNEIVRILKSIAPDTNISMGQNVKTIELRPDAAGNITATSGGQPVGNVPATAVPVVKQGEEIGRNDPCPCGSGKKWKNCGLKNIEEHQKLMAGKV